MRRLVEPMGPPLVIIYTGAKLRKLKAVFATRTNDMVLVSNGRVILNVFLN
jgi:hypothetical protein